jgi:sugar-specific transcriptional regulator TrmB
MIHVGAFAYPVSHKLSEMSELFFKHGTIHWVSNGDWSAIDLLLMVLSFSEAPAIVTLSSYAFSERPARIIADLISRGKIRELHCIIDSRVDVRSASAFNLIQSAATQCVLVDTHAKVTVIEMGEMCYSIIGSANYTSNTRYEAGLISREPDIGLFHKKWISDAINAKP